ncbi:PAP/25A associated domain family [Aspergillus clavatus NRRL 1]|uniref:polynucleotide adenylyltransferase n=1 Tax=Aspergillus clavatus (strain ATCC 1007 / CBS 513.65 / DSM 816 / NCTC 3887 / NRRL 1 / QM 1276 / 107) TaxID=344612 RepID=A1CAS6_ASPCL|nr:PAP/25A associated domain family [Aspergillus clavatus NRRL 1]EAW12844.1 PAP/25A associated domain family [Aspergillus clavatus NRRL 1]
MPWNLSSTDSPSEAHSRPPLTSQQSNSLPSTPYQHARNLSFHSRTPSPPHGSTSPRSTHSESIHLPPSLRKPFTGCKYETAMAFFRRRIPYTIGTDLLPEEKAGLKERLDSEDEKRLTQDMLDIYDRLLPSAESDDRRRQLVRKLEKLFNDQWPGRDIKVHVFGSSGNKLCSSDSDVDICITTTYKELEHVCLLAEVLAKHGMERVVCVSHAKVPIVKIWDPELRLACDMNVNNTLALENTRMVRTYVEIDDRVRPLAMIIKYWTKRRILNDAGLGGTLSSYTWICLIINFLQTRDPPVLPSLQARPHKKRTTADGLVCSFDDDLGSLTGFGRKNKQTLGELLFHFFRYYGHELDFEKYVISVREGKLISKEEKGWHLLQNNRLCVEEPFNTSRNLGNTADDTSFRGVHMELRRAFKAVSEGNLEDCCEQYEYPPEEERLWERPPPQPRPTLTAPPQPSRGGRGGGRGGRHSNQYTRGGHAGGRRASNNASNKPNGFRQANPNISATELSLQAQHAQYLLHDHLYQQIQILQAQEQELRLQLQNQALLTGRPPPVLIRQPFIQFPMPQQQQPQPDSAVDDSSRSRAGTHPPLNATLRPVYNNNATYLPIAVTPAQGGDTNPPSPSAATALPELRRTPRRQSVANGSPGRSLRAHSQPARPGNSPALQSFAPLYSVSQPVDSSHILKPRNNSGSPAEGDQNEDDHGFIPSSMPNVSRAAYLDENRPSEYMGYYLATSPQLQVYHQNAMLSPLSAPVGLALQNGSILPFVGAPQGYMSTLATTDSFGSPPESGVAPNSKVAASQPRATPRPVASHDRNGPLIVDGSVPLSEQRAPVSIEGFDHYGTMSHCTSNSDDRNTDTPASISDSYSQDYQDNSSVEIDQPMFFPRQAMDAPKLANAGDAWFNGHSEKPGLLSSRLQNLHVSHTEKMAEKSPKSSPEQFRGGQPRQDIADHDAYRSKQSPAERGSAPETHASSPNSKRRSNHADSSEKPNGVAHKAKAKHRHDNSHHSSGGSGDSKERHVAHPSRKTNGIAPAAHDSSSHHGNNGWQTTKKKQKKGAKSMEHRPGFHASAEPLPAEESLRKGG